MQNLFLNLSKCSKTFLSIILALSLAACQKEDDPVVIPDSSTFEGTFTTSIPAMPDFTPVMSDIEVNISWLDSDMTSAKISLDAFTIDTGIPGREYAIAAMEITDIECTGQSNGEIALKCDSFTTKAGEMTVTGNLEGVYKDGQLTFTIIYKPGSMPFEVKSVFVSK